MKLLKKKGSRFWWYDFKLPGVPRQRASTKETNETRAEKIAALKLSAALEGRYPLRRKVPYLFQQWESFGQSKQYLSKDADTRRYYANGWRLIKNLPIARMRLCDIRLSDVTDMQIPGSSSNMNNAMRTVRRLLNIAVNAGILAKCPSYPGA